MKFKRVRNGRLSIAVKVPVEIAVEVASSRLLFASFAFSNFSSKRVLDYASSQHGMNQFWFINKEIQHCLLGELARLVMGTIF